MEKEAVQKIQQEPIAIVGIGCRFPGAENSQAFWQALREGKDAISEVPAHRWTLDKLYSPDPLQPGKIACKWGGFVEHIDQFDWRMFSISPREARYMDPQHRLLLEVAWEALEDAGIPFKEVAGTQTSVSIGASWNDYQRLQTRDWSQLDAYTTGTLSALAANRLSYFFDFRGPSVSLDTACASSLTALSLACQSLWTGEATLALAGGVHLHLSPDAWIIAGKAGLLSATGHCKTLDTSADGFVFGEGAGIVVLKPFSLLRPSDRVYALLRGVGVSHNGHNEWIMSTSEEAQERLLRQTYSRAGVDPAEIDYVELHGTGFLKGDAVEARALGAVVGRQMDREHPCAIGSVKTNIGHLDAAAGIAGLIKVALSLYHRELPPTLHLQVVNPDIPLAELQLVPQKERAAWPLKREGRPLAGVTALGLTGTNVHAILEGYHVAPQQPAEVPQARLLPLSAASESALLSQVTAFMSMLETTTNSWQDICYMAGTRRNHHACRLALVANTRQEAATLLNAVAAGGLSKSLQELPEELVVQRAGPAPHKLVFVFRENGVDWTGLDLIWLQGDPLYRQVVDRCQQVLAKASHTIASFEPAKLDNAAGLFALHVTLAELWRSRGIVADALFAECGCLATAAHVAGLVSLEDALELMLSARSGRVTEITSSYSSDRENTNWGEVTSLPSTAMPIYTVERGRVIDRASLEAALRSEAPTILSETMMQPLQMDGYDLFVELGPQTVSQGFPTLSQERSEATWLLSLGRLYTLGYAPNWSVLSSEGSRCVSLPTYPWQRERLWLDWLDVEEISTPPETRDKRQEKPSRSLQEERGRRLWQQLETIATDQWATLLLSYLRQEISVILDVDARTLQISRSLFSLGMDSLTAVQLLNRLQKDLECSFSPTMIFRYPTIERLAEYLVQEMLFQKQDKQNPSILNSVSSTLAQLEELSEIEVETLLTSKLAMIEERY